MTPKREKKGPSSSRSIVPAVGADYGRLVSEISGLLERARRTSARAVNGILSAAYWDVGRRIVEFEQDGKARAEYGKELLVNLGNDLTRKHGRGFSWRNIYQMRAFYIGWEILQTPSAKLEAKVKCPAPSGKSATPKWQTPSAKSANALAPISASIRQGPVPVDAFPLSWSQYVRLMAVTNLKARVFYAKEHLTMPGEADPVGIILCSDKDEAVVKYATSGIKTKVFASKYLTNLPDAESLRQEILKAQRLIVAQRKENING